MEHRNRSRFSGVLLITLAVVIMVCAAASGLDGSCQALFENQLPAYPKATRVSEESRFLQYRQATYVTSDATQLVKDWYDKAIYVALSESLAKTGSRGNVWDGEWDIQSTRAGGSTIVLKRSCG